MADPRTILSLCAGVGGLELGIMLALNHRGEAGRGICYVEREAAAAASLGASMDAGWLHPAPVWSDLATFDGRPWRGVVDILASGDPCQDNSVAGKRAGSGGQRFLAPEVCRIADECRPRLIVRENVPGNAAEQLAAIVPPLERLGYRVAAGVFSSAATGNTMRRERLFVMACARDVGQHKHAELDGEPERSEQLAFSRRHTLRRGDKVARPECVDGNARTDVAGRSSGGGADDVAGRPGQQLAGASGARSQGIVARQPVSGGRQAAQRHAGLGGRAALPPVVVPGPADPRWRDVLDRFPELQPALSEEEAQSHLRRGADAMADRVERLRATGNGVDPMVAAHAILSLGALLGV